MDAFKRKNSGVFQNRQLISAMVSHFAVSERTVVGFLLIINCFLVRSTSYNVENFHNLTCAEVVPAANDSPQEIAMTLIALFPTNGTLFYRQQLTRPALNFALDYVKAYTLPGLNIRLEYIGTSELETCDQVNSMIVYKTIDQVVQMRLIAGFYNNVALEPVAYFGPGCTNALKGLAIWLNATSVPLFDAVASSYSLRDKSSYPTLIRTGYTDRRLSEFYRAFFQYFDWKNAIAFVDGKDPIWREIYGFIKNGMPEENSINACGAQYNASYYQRKMEKLQYRTNVVLFFANMDCVKEILVHAVRMNLTEPRGQITFVVNNFYKATYWGSTDIDTTKGGNMSSTDVEDLLKAYNQTLVLSYYLSDELEEKMEILNDILYEYVLSNATKYPESLGYAAALKDEGINPAVIGYYAGVHMYAQALREILDGDFSDNVTSGPSRLHRNGTEIIQKIREKRIFDIPYIGELELNEDGDLPGEFSLKAFDGEYRDFRCWMIFNKSSDEPHIRFPLHFKPASEPIKEIRIDVDGSQKNVNGTVIAMAALVVFVLAGAGLIIRYYVNKARLGNDWWSIKECDLKYLKPKLEREMSTMTGRARCQYDNVSYSDAITIGTTFHGGLEDIELADYKNQIVAVRQLNRKPHLCSELLIELRDIRLNNHVNLLRFYGFCVDNDNAMVVTEYAPRGSLADLLAKQQITLEWPFRYSLLNDLLEAVKCIHKSFGYHGNLTTLNCMIDRPFVLKVRDYAPKCLQPERDEMEPWDQLWTAPEILRKQTLNKADYQRADIYSVGIMLQELAMGCQPFPNRENHAILMFPAEEIINLVGNHCDPPFRPVVPEDACNARYHAMMEGCWNERPLARPDITELKNTLRLIRGPIKANILDDLLKRLESFADQLQHQVDERTQQLKEEQLKMQALLYELLPKSVADKLISKTSVEPEPFDCVTVYFSDIVSFTTISAESTPSEVVNMLNQLYNLFDGIIDNYDAYKVETIGDAYMVVSGLPNRNGNAHASIISKLAMNILQAAGNFRIPHRNNEKINLRIGLHSGPCVAGIVGNKMPRYCLFGDTINTASRMESTSEPNKIQLSFASQELIKGMEEFNLESRGIINVKGKGNMETFWLLPGRTFSSFRQHSSTMTSVATSTFRRTPSNFNKRQSLNSILSSNRTMISSKRSNGL